MATKHSAAVLRKLPHLLRFQRRHWKNSGKRDLLKMVLLRRGEKASRITARPFDITVLKRKVNKCRACHDLLRAKQERDLSGCVLFSITG